MSVFFFKQLQVFLMQGYNCMPNKKHAYQTTDEPNDSLGPRQKHLVEAADQYLDGKIDSEEFKRMEQKYGPNYESIVTGIAKIRAPFPVLMLCALKADYMRFQRKALHLFKA
jgi:hypothetical protein